MRFITRIAIVGAVAVTLALSASSAIAANDSPIVIKFSHVVANNTPKGEGAQMFKKMVEEQLGGKVKVEIYPNSSLYDDTKGLNALLNNDIQLLAPSMAKLGQYSSSVQLFDLPFLFDNLDALTRFEQSNAGKKILTSLQDHGLLGLSYWHNGLRQITANTPVVKPTDVRGLKLRVEPSKILAAQVSILHGIPRKMAFGEVYQGMQTGVIDGQGGNTWSNIKTQNWDEVQSDMTVSNNGVLEYMVLTNAKFWNGLPSDVRSKLEKILATVTQSVNEKANQVNADARKEIADSGRVKIHELTPDQLKAWREAMQPVIDKYSGEVGPDLVKAAQQSNNS